MWNNVWFLFCSTCGSYNNNHPSCTASRISSSKYNYTGISDATTTTRVIYYYFELFFSIFSVSFNQNLINIWKKNQSNCRYPPQPSVAMPYPNQPVPYPMPQSQCKFRKKNIIDFISSHCFIIIIWLVSFDDAMSMYSFQLITIRRHTIKLYAAVKRTKSKRHTIQTSLDNRQSKAAGQFLQHIFTYIRYENENSYFFYLRYTCIWLLFLISKNLSKPYVSKLKRTRVKAHSKSSA